MRNVDVLILGGGVAGLACRAGLSGHRSSVVLEREVRPGGLLKMYNAGSYAFDTVLHVLFFRNPRMRAWISDLLPEGWRTFNRHNAIWQNHRLIDYPYQYHAHQLPEAARSACLDGFRRRASFPEDASFHAWLRSQFGEGFYHHFFKPYNEKLYGVPLDQLEAAPMTWTIPPENEQVILDSATGSWTRPNLPIHYPRGAAGIEAIPRALIDLSPDPIYCGDAVVRIDPVLKRVDTAQGKAYSYDQLVCSLPLNVLVDLIEGVPPEVRGAWQRLETVPVVVIEVAGIPEVQWPYHWVYFPDQDIPFYRLTQFDLLAPEHTPPGHISLLLECSGATPPPRRAVTKALETIGLLHEESICHYRARLLDPAYVLFSHGYEVAVRTCRTYLQQQDIFLVGRYGRWQYVNIEQTIEDGLTMAAQLTNMPRLDQIPKATDVG